MLFTPHQMWNALPIRVFNFLPHELWLSDRSWSVHAEPRYVENNEFLQALILRIRAEHIATTHYCYALPVKQGDTPKGS